MSLGPSLKRWPRCVSPTLLLTSKRFMPWLLSVCSVMTAGSMGWVKLGQPQCEWNLLDDVNRGSPVTMST